MKGLLSMIWMVLVSISTIASEHDSLMTKGEMYYQQGNHMNAYIIFDGLVSEGVEDGNLFYNYANTALQYEQYSKAIAYYEKALLLNPDDLQVQNNLNFARKKLDIDVVKPTYILSDFLHHYWILAVLWWILLGTVAAIRLIKQKHLRMFLSAILMLITIFTSTLAYDLFVQYQERQSGRYAIVQDDILMYHEPAELSSEVYELSEGMKVKIGKEVNGWVEVSIKKVKKGWVRKEDLILI
jgi:tetratricopeptide (TPR) repeat protein